MDNFARRLLTVLATVLVLFYVGYQIFISAYSPVKVEIAELYDEYETVDTKGLVLRSETLVPMNDEGYIYYMTENGTRVAKDGCIAQLYTDQEAAFTQQQIKSLTVEIEELESIQEQGQNNRTSLDIINTQLKNTHTDVIDAMSSSHFSGIDELSSKLLSLMNKQQITVGRAEGFETRVATLTAERDELLKQETAPIGSVYSPVAGYFVNSVDGFETVLDPQSVLSMTTDEIRSKMEQEPKAEQDGYIGKVVGSYEWYLVCVVPAKAMTHVALDGTVKIRMPFVSNDTIPMTLVAENRDRNGDLAVIFRCDYMSADLSDIRLEDVQILVKQHSGIRVPDEAVRFNEQQEAGVFVKEGNVIVFRRIQVAYHSKGETYSICSVVDEDGYLQVYDDIVTEGKRLYDGKIV